jgi:hypothetical protein
MNNREDAGVAYCSLEELGSIRVAGVVVEIVVGYEPARCIDLDYYSSYSNASRLPLFYRRAATEATEATMTLLQSAAKRARGRVVSTEMRTHT